MSQEFVPDYASRQDVLEDFYHGENPGICVDELKYENDQSLMLSENKLWIPNPGIELDEGAVDEKIGEFSRNLTLIAAGDNRFEITTTTPQQGEPYTLHFATYSSSISGNAGNLYELSMLSALHPDQNIVYVAPFGNGGTSPLPNNGERQYVQQTGRFTQADETGAVVPIPSLVNLNRALETAGVPVTTIGTDSAGGNYATGLTLSMEPGQLTRGFFSERTAFVNLSVAGIVGGMLLREGKIEANLNGKLSDDDWRVGIHERAQKARGVLEQENPQILAEIKETGLSKIQSLANLIATMHALRRGPSGTGNPLLADTNAMRGRHPEANLVYGMAEQDPLYRSPEIAPQAARDFLGGLTLRGPNTSVLMLPWLSHAYHTTAPQLYHAVRNYALADR